MATAANPELVRLADGQAWKAWGPYLSDRAWGSVREDESEDGNAWKYFPHDHARRRAFRWGEDGIGGISDKDQILCFALALWNGKDSILKERLFGLDNGEGNHGEDAKEYWFHTDSTPTHSSMRMLYKYPQAAFPYGDLVATNGKRGKHEPEYELIDTGVFAHDRYFDVEIEYAKAGPEDIAVLVRAHNRGDQASELHLLPTVWFRNTWSWGPDRQLGSGKRPELRAAPGAGNSARIAASHEVLGEWELLADRDPAGHAPALLFCENETDRQGLWGQPNQSTTHKGGIGDCVIHGVRTAVNPEQRGTKAAVHYRASVPAKGCIEIRLRLRRAASGAGFADHAAVIAARRAEADAFYEALHPAGIPADWKAVQRQAWSGMLWSKQWFALDVPAWSRQIREDGKPRQDPRRNQNWNHFSAGDVMSMPDKWEYPWFAAWDLAFHTIALAYVDPEFAKSQLLLLVNQRFQAPNGAVPAYEWNFDDCNPPVIARAAWRVYCIERDRTGKGDQRFLETMFLKLGDYYTWWLNLKDASGANLFQGGFLGLDNIGVFDRSSPLPTGGHLEQADGTAWMGIFATDMAVIGLELSQQHAAYTPSVARYILHFLYLGVSLNNIGGNIGGKGVDLWDRHDGFFYDVLRYEGRAVPLKVRSMVGLLPLAASLAFPDGSFKKLGLIDQMQDQLATRGRLAQAWKELVQIHPGGINLASLVSPEKFGRIIRHLLDEAEFLSDHGIRGLSKHHAKEPYTFYVGGTPYSVGYVPGDSDSFLFGGNSNWRGPVWMPVNYVLITALKRWHAHLGDGYKVEFPTGSKQQLTLGQVADELSKRLVALFARGKGGRRPCNGGVDLFDHDKHWKDHINFAEYFHGDNGKGIGATHQTGWTGLVAALIQELAAAEAVPMPVAKTDAPAKPATPAPAPAPAPAAKAKPVPATKAKPAPAVKPKRGK